MLHHISSQDEQKPPKKLLLLSTIIIGDNVVTKETRFTKKVYGREQTDKSPSVIKEKANGQAWCIAW